MPRSLRGAGLFFMLGFPFPLERALRPRMAGMVSPGASRGSRFPRASQLIVRALHELNPVLLVRASISRAPCRACAVGETAAHIVGICA